MDGIKEVLNKYIKVKRIGEHGKFVVLNTNITTLEKELKKQLSIYSVSNSCGIGDTSILIKGLEDISNWDDEQEEWYDDPGHCANMTLIKYYNSKK